MSCTFMIVSARSIVCLHKPTSQISYALSLFDLVRQLVHIKSLSLNRIAPIDLYCDVAANSIPDEL